MGNVLTWVTCDGGPHLLIPEELGALWEGSDAPSGGRVVNARFRWSADPGALATDYDAACDVNELVGVIPVGAGAALVLGDEVPMSTWVPSTLFAGGLIVVPMTWPHPGMPEQRLLAAAALARTGCLGLSGFSRNTLERIESGQRRQHACS